MTSTEMTGHGRGSATKLYKYGTLSLLYFVQGAPYGFQTGCLPLILRQSGLSFSSLGAMKLLFMPWVCKPLYAPVIENTKSKQWWLLASISALGLTCLLASWTSLEMMWQLLMVLFMLNLASASQDICVDSLALEILDPEELGAGNTIQVVAYKAGSVFAGAALLWVKEASSWSRMWTVFSGLYLLCLLLVVGLGLGHKSRSKENEDKSSTDDKLTLNLAFLMENWKKMLKVPGTYWMIMFVVFYKLCERGEGTLPIYLVDKAVPMSALAFFNGVVRSVASISGSMVGGLLLSSQSYKPGLLMFHTACLRVVPLSIQYIIIVTWGTQPISNSLDSINFDSIMFYLSIISLCLGNFCAGLITTATFTTMMTLSQSAETNIQTSHYSLLATMEVMGKLMFASVAGAMIDTVGLDKVFILFVILAILTLPLLTRMPDMDSVKPHCDKQKK